MSTRKQLLLKHRNCRGRMMYKFLLPLKKLSLIHNKGTVSTWTQFQDFQINRTPRRVCASPLSSYWKDLMLVLLSVSSSKMPCSEIFMIYLYNTRLAQNNWILEANKTTRHRSETQLANRVSSQSYVHYCLKINLSEKNFCVKTK